MYNPYCLTSLHVVLQVFLQTFGKKLKCTKQARSIVFERGGGQTHNPWGVGGGGLAWYITTKNLKTDLNAPKDKKKAKALRTVQHQNNSVPYFPRFEDYPS